jgi:hypothetical protein
MICYKKYIIEILWNIIYILALFYGTFCLIYTTIKQANMIFFKYTQLIVHKLIRTAWSDPLMEANRKDAPNLR